MVQQGKYVFLVAAILGMVAPYGAAFAQAQPERLPGVIDKPIPQDALPEAVIEGEKPGAPLEKAPEKESVTDGAKVLTELQEVRFSGNSVFTQERLLAITSPYVGHSFTKDDLARLKYDITKAYYDQGYILVKVTTPPQDLSSGTLQVDIYEARVGDVVVAENSAIHPFLANSYLMDVERGKVFHEGMAEPLVRNLDDLHGVSAALNLKPGREFLTTDLNMVITPAKEDQQQVYVDNYGSELTGENVATVHLEKSNLLHWGEQFRADVRKSDDELWSVNLGADAPIGYKGIIAEASYLHSENEIGDRLALLEASGETDAVDVGFSKKLLNTRKDEWKLKGGFESRQHESFLADVTDTKDDLRKFYVQNDYLHLSPSFLWFGSLKVSRGVDMWGSSRLGDAGATRAAGEPEAWIVQPLLAARYTPGFNSEVRAVASGQLASHTLLSSDLFVVGGYGTVRGFEPAEEAGEDGYQLSLEYLYQLPINTDDFTVKVGPFFDTGSVYNRIDDASDQVHLHSAGLGVETALHLLPQRDTTLRLDWAKTVGDYDSPEIDDHAFYFRLGQAF